MRKVIAVHGVQISYILHINATCTLVAILFIVSAFGGKPDLNLFLLTHSFQNLDFIIQFDIFSS